MKKRILAMLLVALLAASMASCNREPGETTQEKTSISTQDTTGDLTGDTQKPADKTGDLTEDVQKPIVDKNDLVNTSDTPYNTDELGEVLQLPNALLSVLKNETKLCYANDGTFMYLSDLVHRSELFACVSALDLDQNGVKEILFLEVGDIAILLREYEGTVYTWSCRHSGMYNLRVDGTYDWHEQAGNIQGTDKLHFDDAKRNDIGLHRSEYGEKFYVKGIEVSEEEYQTLLENETLAEEVTRYYWKTKQDLNDDYY